MLMLNRKFFLGAILSMAVWLSACSNSSAETSETVSESAAAEIVSSGETTADKPISEQEPPVIDFVDSADEAAAENDTGNPETGLVYFIQPIIKQYDKYDDWHLSDWECRDTEVLRDFHYDGEWNYGKELVFVFSNYTDEPVTIDSIQILRESDEALVSFADGSNALDIDFTVQPGHKTDYLLQTENFDYSACESGIYNAIVNVGLEGYGREFFIDNSELYEEQHIAENQISLASDSAVNISNGYTVYAPMFLNEEQRHIFAQAHGLMQDWFWCDHNMPQNYTDTHTADDFMTMLYEVFTEEYAKGLAADYIDDNGEFLIYDAGRGSNIFYCGHCFLPVSSDDEQVTFKATVVYCHSDNPYEVWFEDIDYHMVNTENGWRVDRFDLWN